jgi:hypothetical protein
MDKPEGRTDRFIQTSIPDEVYRRLRVELAHDGGTIAGLLRKAVARYLDRRVPRDRAEA